MAKNTLPKPKNYEEAIADLENLIQEIEKGEIGLEEVLARYEKGLHLLRYCQETLNQAEKQIELIARNPDNVISTSPLPKDE